jgi:hypothetical protein
MKDFDVRDTYINCSFVFDLLVYQVQKLKKSNDHFFKVTDILKTTSLHWTHKNQSYLPPLCDRLFPHQRADDTRPKQTAEIGILTA